MSTLSHIDQTQVALWSVPCLEEGLKLISRLDPYKEEAVDPIPGMYLWESKSLLIFSMLFLSLLFYPVTGHPSRLPDLVKDIMMNSHIFWMFPHFLPKMRFCKNIFSMVNSWSLYICSRL